MHGRLKPLRRMQNGRILACVLAGLMISGLGAPQASAQAVEAVDRSALRVCADPAALPFSAVDGTGFENRIAELLAKDLGVPVRYTWFPSTMGFYRRTLNDRKCDVVIGAPAELEMAASTVPYYRSTFMLVTRASDPVAVTGLDDPGLAGRTIGVQAQTQAVDLLARRPLITNIHSYGLMVDSRITSVGHEMIADLAAGKIDAAIIWGPVAAYQADQLPGTFRLLPLGEAVDGIPMAFDMAMAVRNGEPQWRARLDRFIEARRPEIAAILAAAKVPAADGGGETSQ